MIHLSKLPLKYIFIYSIEMLATFCKFRGLIGFVTILFFLCTPFLSLGQCMLTGYDLSERKAQSDTVLLASIYFIDSYLHTDGNIYSRFKLVTNRDTFFTTKIGGRIGELTQIIQPDFTAHSGQKGLFFVNTIDQKNCSFACGPYSYIAYEESAGYFYDVMQKYTKEDLLNVFPENRHAFDGQLLDKNTATFRFTPPIINDVYPDTITAGTESVLTITGSNFGNNAIGLASIDLRNPDVGVLINAYQPVPPNHILSWANNKIKIIVPGRDPISGHPGAGSGSFRLKNTMGELTYSPPLTVLYNRFLLGANQQLSLQNDNGLGGYTITYNSNFIANEAAYLAHQRALKTWQCEPQINITASLNTTNKNCPVNDGINLIAFDDKCPLSIGVLAQTTHWFITCSDGQPYFLEMDVIFDKQANWNYDVLNTDLNKFDFESTALHEFGHFQGIGHSLEEGNTMFPNIFPGTINRSIDIHTKTCSDHIANDSEAASNSCSIPLYKRLPSCKDSCKIALEVIELSGCNNGNVIYQFNLAHDKSDPSFDVFVDDIFYNTILYNSGNLTIFDVAIIADGKSHIVKVKDKFFSYCNSSITLKVADCTCNIETLFLQQSACQNDSVVYDIAVSNRNFSTLGFYLLLDGVVYSNQALPYYNLNNTPYSIKIIADGQEHNLKIIDVENNLCVESKNVVVPDCRCKINGKVNFLKCENEQPYFALELNHSNTGSGYQWYLDKILLSPTLYAYDVSGISSATIALPKNTKNVALTIKDIDKQACQFEEMISAPDCNCQLNAKVLSVSPCDKDSFDLELQIDYNRLYIGSFNVYLGAEVIQSLEYQSEGQSILKIRMLGNDAGIRTLSFIDALNNQCRASLDFDVPDCSCNFDLAVYPTNVCDDFDTTEIKFTLYHTNKSSDYFMVKINELESTIKYNTSDSTVFTLRLKGDGEVYKIEIRDGSNPKCKVELFTTTYNCKCGLSAQIEEVLPCQEKEQFFSIILSNNIRASLVDIYLDDVKINGLPLSIDINTDAKYDVTLLADGTSKKLTVIDIADEKCTANLLLQTSDCSCFKIKSVQNKIACDESGKSLWVISLNDVNGNFTVYIDGLLYANLSPIASNFDFNIILIGDGKNHQVELKSDKGDCRLTLEILTALCQCQNNITIGFNDCGEDGFFDLKINLPKANFTTSADVYIDNIKINTSPIQWSSSSEVSLGYNFKGDGKPHTVIVKSANGLCVFEKDLVFPACPCNVKTELIKLSDCDNKQEELYLLSIETTHYSADSFKVYLDGVLQIAIKHNGSISKVLIAIIGDNQVHDVSVINIQNTCQAKLSIATNDCNCRLTLNAIIAQPCINNNQTKVSCVVESKWPSLSTKFMVKVDDAIYSTIIYNASSKYNIDLLLPGDGLSHIISVEDGLNKTCQDTKNIVTAPCQILDTCSLKFLQFTKESCENNIADVEFTFQSSNPTGMYNVFINKAVTNGSPLSYDPSGTNKVNFNAECGSINILVTEGLDGGCSIDTTIFAASKNTTFKYYPNPKRVDENLIIENINKEDYDKLLPLTFYDHLGRKVTAFEVLGQQKIVVALDKINFTSGLYFFTLGSRLQYTGKLIIIR